MAGPRKKTTKSKKYIILPSSLSQAGEETEDISELSPEEEPSPQVPTRAIMPDTSFLEPSEPALKPLKKTIPIHNDTSSKSAQLSLFIPGEEKTKEKITPVSDPTTFFAPLEEEVSSEESQDSDSLEQDFFSEKKLAIDLSPQEEMLPEEEIVPIREDMPEEETAPIQEETASEEEIVPIQEETLPKKEKKLSSGTLFEEEELPIVSSVEKKQWTSALATLEMNPEELARLEKEKEDEEWTEEDNVEEEEWQRRIEALLFHWNEPLSLQKLKECVGFKGANQELRQILLRYQQKILAQEHSFELLEIANGFIFKSKLPYTKYLRRLTRAHVPFRPSQAVLETLSIIAYKQPVKRSVVENIRGVSSSPIINTLIERNLIQVVGRAKGPGNPKLYGTTDEFLNLFGLKSLEDLPQPEKDF